MTPMIEASCTFRPGISLRELLKPTSPVATLLMMTAAMRVRRNFETWTHAHASRMSRALRKDDGHGPVGCSTAAIIDTCGCGSTFAGGLTPEIVHASEFAEEHARDVPKGLVCRAAGRAPIWDAHGAHSDLARHAARCARKALGRACCRHDLQTSPTRSLSRRAPRRLTV